MISLLADENIVGLEHLPADEVRLTRVPGRSIDRAKLRGVDVLWVRSVTPVDPDLIDDSALKSVGTATAGIDHIDLEALAARGIGFAAAPGSNANAVVEYVIAALLELREPWSVLESGAELGVVGYGEVGRRLCDFALSMGWRVCVSDPWLDTEKLTARAAQKKAPVPRFTNLAELLKSRVISLHCDLHGRRPWPSHHLIESKMLAKLDDSQWLINAARGPIIDNDALAIRLRKPSPPNCVLDVWEGEPDFAVDLLKCRSLVLATPHIAGYSWDAKWTATCMLYADLEQRGLVSKPIATSTYRAEPLRIDHAAAYDSLELGRALMTQRYRIAEDDARLRSLAPLDSQQRAAGFDRLRRDYPERRELRGSVLAEVETVESTQCPRLCRAFGITF